MRLALILIVLFSTTNLFCQKSKKNVEYYVYYYKTFDAAPMPVGRNAKCTYDSFYKSYTLTYTMENNKKAYFKFEYAGELYGGKRSYYRSMDKFWGITETNYGDDDISHTFFKTLEVQKNGLFTPLSESIEYTNYFHK
jgi:hypothetical protein